MPARNKVSTSCTAPDAASKTTASNGNAGTSMCSAAGAIAVTRAKSAIGGGRGRASSPVSATRTARREQSEWHRASDHAAVQDPPIFTHVVIGDSAMEQAAVIPHDEITLAPAVGVHELPLRGVLEQLFEEGSPLGLGHAADVRGMVAKIERLAAGIRMGPHERVIDRRLIARRRDRVAPTGPQRKTTCSPAIRRLSFPVVPRRPLRCWRTRYPRPKVEA